MARRTTGQANARARYSAQASGVSFGFAPSGSGVAFTQGKQGHLLEKKRRIP